MTRHAARIAGLLPGVALVLGLALDSAASDAERELPREDARELPRVGAFAPSVAAPLARAGAAVAGLGALGWGLTAWSRRRRNRLGGGDTSIEVLARRGLGPRHHLAVVQVGSQRLLIGMAGDTIAPIANLTESEPFSEQLDQELRPADGSEERALVDSIGPFPGLDD